MTDLQMLENSFCEFGRYRRTKDLVPLFEPKVHHFENSLIMILAQLYSKQTHFSVYGVGFSPYN